MFRHHRHHHLDPITVNFNLNVAGELKLTIKEIPPSSPLAGVWMTLKMGGFIVKGKAPMSYTLPDDMLVHVQVAYVDKSGNPAAVDGDTSWTSSSDDIASVEVDPDDSTHATVTAHSLGHAQITSTADADLGGGQRQIMATLDINVVAGEAVSAAITPSGDPEDIPGQTTSASRTR